VDLGDQRAGCIEYRQAPACGFFLDAPRHPVGTEHGDGTRRYFRQVLDEYGAFVLQAFDHVFVVNDLVAHVDRRPVFLERALDDLDRTHDPGAKSARLCQIHSHRRPWSLLHQLITVSSKWGSGCIRARPDFASTSS
jgi:hypothetical protein